MARRLEKSDRKKHWEKIYQTKSLNEVAWYQPIPDTSLRFFSKLEISRDAKIIDIGGGDSYLAEYLLELGFQDITVLDISEESIKRAKKRLGKKADNINWIVGDVLDFLPGKGYDVWHDRAAFHFFLDENEIHHYLENAKSSISKKGYIILGTFSTVGPDKCSGLEINQYSEESMTRLFENDFVKVKCLTTDHITPFNTIQNFVFCCFRKR